MFSEKLAQIDSQCIADMRLGVQNSPFCITVLLKVCTCSGGDGWPLMLEALLALAETNGDSQLR